MPGVESQCVTHHHACDCREAMIKRIAERFLHEHLELARFMAGFAKPSLCFCAGCIEARKLLGVSAAHNVELRGRAL